MVPNTYQTKAKRRTNIELVQRFAFTLVLLEIALEKQMEAKL